MAEVRRPSSPPESAPADVRTRADPPSQTGARGDAPPAPRSRLARLGDAGAAIASLEPSRPALKWTLRFGLAALVIGAVTVAVAREVAKLDDVTWHFEPVWLLAALVALALFQASAIELWRHVLADLATPIRSHVQAGAIWSASLLARYVPTNALMAMTRIAMAEKVGVPKRMSLASVAYELALSVAGAMVVAAWFVTRLESLQPYWWRYLAFAVPVAVIAALHPSIFTPVANRVFARLEREPLHFTLGLRKVLVLVLGYAVAFVIAGLSIVAVAHSVTGVDASELPVLIGSYSVGYALSLIGFFLPGGLGAREAGIAATLSSIMPLSAAVAVAVISRLGQILVELAFAGAMSLLVRRRAAAGAGAEAEAEAAED